MTTCRKIIQDRLNRVKTASDSQAAAGWLKRHVPSKAHGATYWPAELQAQMKGACTLLLLSRPMVASADSPRASTLMEREHFAARTREILPLNFGAACPMSDAW